MWRWITHYAFERFPQKSLEYGLLPRNTWPSLSTKAKPSPALTSDGDHWRHLLDYEAAATARQLLAVFFFLMVGIWKNVRTQKQNKQSLVQLKILVFKFKFHCGTRNGLWNHMYKMRVLYMTDLLGVHHLCTLLLSLFKLMRCLLAHMGIVAIKNPPFYYSDCVWYGSLVLFTLSL